MNKLKLLKLRISLFFFIFIGLMILIPFSVLLLTGRIIKTIGECFINWFDVIDLYLPIVYKKRDAIDRFLSCQ